MCNVADNYFILTCCDVYIPPEFPHLVFIIFLSYSAPAKYVYTNLQPGENGNNPGGSTCVAPNTPLSGTQLGHRHLVVQWNVGISAAKNMTVDAHLKTIRKSGSSKNMKLHTIGYE
jgi:hypothetical protein